MTIPSVNTNKLPNVENPKVTQQVDGGAVSAEEKLAVIAFQKIYEMMLDGSEGTDSSSMLNTLLLYQLGNEGYSDVLTADSSLNALGEFNINARIYNDFSKVPLPIERENLNNDIGALSAKYESNGNPGVIANNPGDPGGKSYGAWQFSSRMGSLNSFVNWLQSKNPEYYNRLVEAKNNDNGTYGRNFDNTWRDIAAKDKESFLNLQYNYVKMAFYDSAAVKLQDKFGFNVNDRSEAMKNVLWSTVVQHGSNGAISILSKVNLNGSDEEIIKDIYNERQKVNIYFKSSSPSIKMSVYNRFSREQEQALAMLRTNNA